MKAKRFLALALALVTALAVIPFTATAVAVNPISSAEQLVTLMNTPEKWDGAYYLTADIDLTGVENQTPIGIQGNAFSGYFDGMGHSITGLDIEGEKHLGLFGWVHNATIKNLSVSGSVTASTTDSRGNGGLAGVLSGNSLIENVSVSVSVTSQSAAVGGLAGYVFPYATGTVNIINCHSDSTVKGALGVGSLIGIMTAGREQNTNNPVTSGTVNVIDCSSDGTVYYAPASGYYGQSGGLIGQILHYNSDDFEINIIGCVNNAVVLSDAADQADKGRVGGIVGWIASGNSEKNVGENVGVINIASCVNNAELKARAGLGGIVGVASIYDSADYALNVLNCANYGNLTTSAGGYNGGIIGWVEGGDVTISACKNDGTISAAKTNDYSYAGGVLGYAGLVSGAAGLTLEVSNSANYASVTGTGYYAGGVIGTIRDGVYNISDCANYGSVTADRAVGGIIGWAQRATADAKWKIELSNSFNSGTIYGPTKLIGSIFGYPHASFPLTVSNCYYLEGSAKQGSTVQNAVGHATAGSVTADITGYNSLSALSVNSQDTVSNLNASAAGTWEQGTDYPELTALKSLPAEETVTEITNISLTVGTDLSFNAFATLADGVDAADTKVVFTYADEEPVEAAAEAVGDLYKYTLKALSPQAMTELITVELYVDDELVDKTQQTVRGYCEQLIDNDENSDELVQLAKDILAYGAAAQEYRDYNLDSLANEGIEGATEFAQLGEGKYIANLENGEAVDGVKFTGIGVRFDYVNSVFFKLTAPSVDGITVTVNGNECAVEEYGDSYIVYSDPINATEFDGEVVAVLKYGDTVVQTVTYSVASFVYEMQNAENSEAADLAKALYNYGLSAIAYSAN